MNRGAGATSQLVINADDYGYFRCVSRGIREGVAAGIITATGVMTNRSGWEGDLGMLSEAGDPDVGVHLNLTSGEPVTGDMADRLGNWGGRLPPKFSLLRAVVTGQIPRQVVLQEWRSQVRRCLDAGIQVRFLNSHEHVHMLPGLFQMTAQLADEFHIPWLRRTQAEWGVRLSAGGILRNVLVAAMDHAGKGRGPKGQPRFLGLARSGRLDRDYLLRLVRRLRPGGRYELMCHPGRFDPTEINEMGLLAYHDWEGELQNLMSRDFRHACKANGVDIVRFRDLNR